MDKNINNDKLQKKYELLDHIWSSGSKLFLYNQKMSYLIQFYVCSVFAKDEELLPEDLKTKGKQMIKSFKEKFKDLISKDSFSKTRKEYEQMLLNYFNLLKKEEKENGLSMELSEKYRVLYYAK